MVSASIKTMLISFFLWKIGVGQPKYDNGLLVLETSIYPSVENDSRQNFRISFQLKGWPTDDDFYDGFENRQLKFAILDKNERQRLDEKSIVLDGNSMKMKIYDGKLLGLILWSKSANRKQLQVDGYFDKNANETIFLVEEMNKSNWKQRLVHRMIIFEDKIKLNVFMKTVNDERVDEVTAGTMVTVFCKAHSTKNIKPKFVGMKFLNQKIKTDQTNKEIRSKFRAGKENHLRTIWCVAGGTNRSLTIKVLHAPTDVIIKPDDRDALMAGGHLRCFAADGYPKPTVMWLTTSVPSNGDKFHRIDQTTNSSSIFILNDNAPIGSVWTIRCRSTNRVGNFTLSVNFTVEVNHTSLLSSRLSKLEEKLQRLQDSCGTDCDGAKQFVNVGSPMMYAKASKVLMFRVIANSGVDAYNNVFLNNGGNYQNLGAGKNYRNYLWDRWGTTKPSAMTVYMKDNMGNVVVELRFLVKSTNSKESWFNINQMISSYPWPLNEMKSTQFNRFAINPNSLNRYFQINVQYGGCHVDMGYMAVFLTSDDCGNTFPPNYLPTNVLNPIIAYLPTFGYWKNKTQLAYSLEMWGTYENFYIKV